MVHAKKYQGLIEIGQGRVTDAQLVGFDPAQDDAGGVTCQAQDGNPGARFACRGLFENPSINVAKSCQAVNKGGYR